MAYGCGYSSRIAGFEFKTSGSTMKDLWIGSQGRWDKHDI
jgi:hypothetical protein